MNEVIQSIEALFFSYKNEKPSRVEKLPQSGSDRIYFRVYDQAETCIATYNLNIKENETFLYFTKHFLEKHIAVPEIFAVSEDKKIYLQEDLGNVSLLNEIVMVGSRSGGRVKTESPVPVDVINLAQATQTTGKTDLTSLLNMLAPSFNYNKQSGGDGADAVDLATLRGLGPDQTLVLINGKRQHQTAFVALFGTRGRGNSGTDLNAIPEASIDHVEILRDGAAAQYGSDAIAGVVNIVLKKDVNHLTVNTGYSGYYDHKYNSLNSYDPNQYYTGSQIDGNTVTLGINDGFNIGKRGGYINLSGDFLTEGKTFREAPDTSQLPVNTGRRAFGDASVTSGGAMLNSEIPVGKGSTKFYVFGGYNYKNSNAYAYTRNYSGAPQKFPTNPDGSLIFVPGTMFYTDPADPSAGDIYYDPIEDVHITDASLA